MVMTNDQKLEKDAIDRILDKIESNEKKFEQLVSDTEHFGLKNIYAFDPRISERLSKDQMYMLVYYGDSLVYWSDSRISVDSCLGDIRDGNSIMLTRNGIFQIYKKTGYHNYLCLYQIKSAYHVQNNYLTNFLNPDFNIEADVDIKLSPQQDYEEVTDKRGHYLFSARISNSEKNYPNYYILIAILLGLILILCLDWAARTAIQEHNFGMLILTSLLSLLFIRILPIYLHIPGFLYESELFRPAKYSSNTYWQSLGDYILNIIVFTRIIYLVGVYVKKNSFIPRERPSLKIFLLLCHIGILTAASIGIRSLIIDSDISLDLQKYNLNGYSALLLLAIILTLTGYIISTDLLYHLNNHKSTKIWHWVLSILAIPVLHNCFNYEWITAISIAICFLLNDWVWGVASLRRELKITFTIPLLVSVMAGLMVFSENQKKELNIKKLFAQSILSNQDYKVQRLLADIDKKIKNDNKINNYIHDEELLNKYLKTKYFGGYLNRFHINILVSDSNAGQEQVQRTDSIYQRQSYPIAQSSFVSTGVFSPINGYVGKYRINGFHQLYIILHSRPFENQSGLNELLTEVNLKSNTNEAEYSWALYKNGQLINSHGVFNYVGQLNENGNYPDDPKEAKNHYILKENHGITVIVTNQMMRGWHVFSYIALFTSSFILFFILIFTINILVLYIIKIPALFQNKKKYAIYIRESLRENYFTGGINFSLLSTRIYLTVGSVILATLTITMLVNQRNITTLYNKNQVEKLTHRMRDIKPEIENLIPLKDGYIQTDDLQEKITPLSESYQTDLNIFDLAGNLIFSTQPRIFETGIISPKMEPHALRTMRIDGKSQVIQNEHLGKLDYLSSYIPLRINEQVVGYLNLPYFTKQAELSEAIRTNILSLLTPYALIFLILGVLSWLLTSSFVRRLNVIREKISTTNLGRKNPKIKWHARDEIGELVKQYNGMVDKLEKSAETLAANERDEAWQEMAKQIAHEIKNPLTPMKLNLQQMQRAFKDQHPQKEEILNKVSRILLEQIDALARLADEFSHFARMPDRHPERLNICEILDDLIQLFAGDVSAQFSNPYIYISADKLEMRRAFTNLFKNAIQAIPEDQSPEILVTADYINDAQMVRIAIRDHGIGIPDELKDKIFVPNFSTKNSGMGLGLAMVRKIVETTGGTIYFESKVGSGTTFYVDLPVAVSSMPEKPD